jgi:hypothetical protein
LDKGYGVAIAPPLSFRINFVSRFTFALAEASVIINQRSQPVCGKYFGVSVEILLFYGRKPVT